MIAKYGSELVEKGFTGDRVANQRSRRRRRRHMVIYGPEYDMWARRHRSPSFQAAMAARVQPLGCRDARPVEQPRDHIRAGTAERCRACGRGIQYAHDDLGNQLLLGAADQFNHRNLGDRYYDPIYELLQTSTARSPTPEYMGLNAVTEALSDSSQFTEWHTVVHQFEAQSAFALDDRARGVREVPAPARCVHGGRLRVAGRAGCTASTSTSSSRAPPRRR